MLRLAAQSGFIHKATRQGDQRRSGICLPVGTGWVLTDEDQAAGGVGRGEPAESDGQGAGTAVRAVDPSSASALQRELGAELPGTRDHAQWEGPRSTQS